MKPKILFLHGFFASGQCTLALTLEDSFKGRADVLSPDLPLHPRQALRLIMDICGSERPDLLVGNSCGSFYAQQLVPVTGIPALLGNPYFMMTEFLEPRIGGHDYKAPRRDGNQRFVIDDSLVSEFAEVQARQFDNYNPKYRDMAYGLFGEHDTLAHFEPLFLKYYPHSYHFPGAHTPTADEVRGWYVPLIERMLTDFVLKR